MLRSFKPIPHAIFTLHNYLEHLVCHVWCNAGDEHTCEQLIEAAFEPAYKKYDWLKVAIDAIYEKCKALTDKDRADIREAFYVNNQIEDICEGRVALIPLSALPQVVADDMSPLLVRFYTELLDRAAIAGTGNKLDYYNQLIGTNKFTTCPCCGLSLIETAESHYVEDNDHYFNKADYPFAVVNFFNLPPLCGKCNKKCKGTKNPSENGRVSFYPFNGSRPNIEMKVTIADSDTLDYRDIKAEELALSFDNDADKVATWDWLFRIKERYNEQLRHLSKTELRLMKKKFNNNKDKTYEELLDQVIDEYDDEKYEDRKFLKIALLKEIKTKPEWLAVYQYL